MCVRLCVRGKEGVRESGFVSDYVHVSASFFCSVSLSLSDKRVRVPSCMRGKEGERKRVVLFLILCLCQILCPLFSPSEMMHSKKRFWS